MAEGRLIRWTSGVPPKSVSYIVAEQDKLKAIDIVRRSAEILMMIFRIWGRVSEPLLAAMALTTAQFVPITGLPPINPKK